MREQSDQTRPQQSEEEIHCDLSVTSTFAKTLQSSSRQSRPLLMQDGSWNPPLPVSPLLKGPAGRETLEGDGGVFSEASSDGELYLDSVTELDSGGDGDFADLTAFLSAEEIHRSLDLALEAFGDTLVSEDPGPPSNPTSQEQAPRPVLSFETENLFTGPIVQHQTKAPLSVPLESTAGEVSSSQYAPPHKPRQVSVEAPPAPRKPTQPVYKQDKPRLVHEGLELNDRSASATEFCSRAATFIEELSSIFKASAHSEQQVEEDSSSPDSGYLTPRGQRPAPQGSASAPAPAPCQEAETRTSQPASSPEPPAGVRSQHPGAPTVHGPLSPPCFHQKLKSQEVAEGSPIHLECRVVGNPLPLVRDRETTGPLRYQREPSRTAQLPQGTPLHLGYRQWSLSRERWFCEGRELHNSPDIQVWRDGDLHTLVIAEAFEDDTGRYTCVASNSIGADNTSAEVYIEGASSSDSEGEGAESKSGSGAMPQVQKKTTSLSLTIRSPSPKTSEGLAHRSTLVQSLSRPPQRIQSPVSSTYGGEVPGPPIFTKLLQDAQASEGQVVVLECRVRGSPPLQVRWYRQGEEILDSPDFRVLQKKPRSAAEPEEICTLVIAEAFPEDGGRFCCAASNPHGSVSSAAQLSVAAAEDCSNSVSGDSSGFEDVAAFPPPPPPSPPPPTEISLLELPPKMPSQPGAFLIRELEIWPGALCREVEVEAEGNDSNLASLSPPKGTTPPPPPPPPPPAQSHPAQSPARVAPDSPPSPWKDGPPLPTKPKPKLAESVDEETGNDRKGVS
ncbi:palladin-like [Cyclopterus lumpus]|uniref:palladin-like n=1 Tax=Cyclopterus lumpus TaxID=8103 RepID=UPI0014875D60|nr:palladin-like [Cyclopterus lumpus]